MKTTLYFTLLTFVTLALTPNSFAQDVNPEYVVRVIYFLPNDRQPDPDIDSKLDTLIKKIQKFYADKLEAHDFDRKTFRFEADHLGNAVVHHVNGKFTAAHYEKLFESNILGEIEEQFDVSRNICFIAVDIGSEVFGSDSEYTFIGIGGGDPLRGHAIIPASNFNAAIHELGHAFGLLHDFREFGLQQNLGKWIFTIDNSDPMISSFCAAHWLDVHRYFNSSQNAYNNNASAEVLTSDLAYPPMTSHLRVKVTDPDGIFQVQLINLEGLQAYQVLNGDRTAIIEFVSDQLLTDHEFEIKNGQIVVNLRILDVHANFTNHEFYIDIPELISTEVVTIPDPNLASSIRKALSLASEDPITRQNIIRLTELDAGSEGITDLTGLEYATRLHSLVLAHNNIKDITPISKLPRLWSLRLFVNKISDITALKDLRNLNVLDLGNNSISDITILQSLPKLQSLFLGNNPISDITVLRSLPKLTQLHLYNNPISDISPVWELSNMYNLEIRNLKILDISPLTKFTGLRLLQLDRTQISDISPLSVVQDCSRYCRI